MRKITKDALGGMVYDAIRRMIADQVLVPGQKLIKKDLGETLGVSQTPVIEALNRLTGEGLVEQRGRSGQFVKKFTYSDLADLFAVRAGLGGVSIRICVEQLADRQLEPLVTCFDGFELPFDDDEYLRYEKADRKFHELIVRLSNNGAIQDLQENYNFIMRTYQRGLIRPPEETLSEHLEIIQAVRERNPVKAQELLTRHDLASRKYIVATYLQA